MSLSDRKGSISNRFTLAIHPIRWHVSNISVVKFRTELPLLIPTIRSKSDEFSSGFCILLTSGSYQAGAITRSRTERGSAPFRIYFDRRLPSAIRQLNLTSRLSASIHDVSNFVQRGNQVLPQARDIEVSIKNSQEQIDAHKRMALTGALGKNYGELDCELDEQLAEGPGPAALDTQQVKEILEQQQTAEIQSVDPSTLRLGGGSGEKSSHDYQLLWEERDPQYNLCPTFETPLTQYFPPPPAERATVQ